MLKIESISFPVKGFSLLLLAAFMGNPNDCISAAAFGKDNNTVPRAGHTRVGLNKHAKIFVESYIQGNRASLSAIRKRSKIPFSIIDSIFRKQGLPVQLKYLAVIESELKTKALSPVGARGPWQFMPETAELLGLNVSRTHDDRTFYNKSTPAAARYLKDLYAEFGDWLLVIAAYNGGPAPVHTAISRSGSRNFWDLQAYLPAESRRHVKRFIAAHYYFEGQGSIATLTKEEWVAYRIKADHEDSHNLSHNVSHSMEQPVAKATPADRESLPL